MADVLENAEKHGYVYAAIAETWGERCPDFEPGCPCCDAWKEYDEMRNRALEDAAKEAERWVQMHLDGDGKVHTSNITEAISSAIRALKEKE